jgi:hypothetical protein
LREVVLNSDDVESAGFANYQSDQKELVVVLSLWGGQKFTKATASHIGRQLAIVWNGRVISAPIIRAAITGRRVNINGLFNDAEAKQLLDLLNHRAPASPRTVEEVLARYTQARGGLAAAQGTTTLIVEGTWESIPGLGTLEAEALLKPPDKWIVALKDEQGLVFQRAFDGAAGWDVSKSFGTTEVDAGTLLVWRILLGLYRGEPMATFLPNMSLKGKEAIGSREASVLEVVLPQSPPARLWFETQTGLLVRIQYAMNGSQFQLDFDDYRDIGGLMLPFKLRETGVESWTLRCREVKRNEPIEDGRFKRPASP